jgi:hypothetical protein
MTEDQNNQELKQRLELIESMLLAGRRQTESWGWTFLLWGIAYYVAIAVNHFTHSQWSWPVTMISAGILTWLLSMRVKKSNAGTTISRVMCSIWISFGISIFLLFISMGINHMLQSRVFWAVTCTLLAMANAISGMTLKWKMQIACAVVWWISAAAICFSNQLQGFIEFLVAIAFCQIFFGIYAMICDAKRRNAGSAHA